MILAMRSQWATRDAEYLLISEVDTWCQSCREQQADSIADDVDVLCSV
jgi:hypothetical protein